MRYCIILKIKRTLLFPCITLTLPDLVVVSPLLPPPAGARADATLRTNPLVWSDDSPCRALSDRLAFFGCLD